MLERLARALELDSAGRELLFLLAQQRVLARFPLLILDTQSDLLDALATRVVVPLAAAGPARSRSMQTLTPAIRVEGKNHLMITPQLAGVAVRELGPVVADASADRPAIVAALDFLVSGI